MNLWKLAYSIKLSESVPFIMCVFVLPILSMLYNNPTKHKAQPRMATSAPLPQRETTRRSRRLRGQELLSPKSPPAEEFGSAATPPFGGGGGGGGGVSFKTTTNASAHMLIYIFFNPRHACAARVAVVVCPVVCPLLNISPLERLFVSQSAPHTPRAAKVRNLCGFL